MCETRALQLTPTTSADKVEDIRSLFTPLSHFCLYLFTVSKAQTRNVAGAKTMVKVMKHKLYY